MIDVRFSPLALWPFPETANRRSRWTFRAKWSDTLGLIDGELSKLKATSVIIETFHRDADLRLDGWPRADAKTPRHPGVILTFDSAHGSLRYGSDACEDWQHNVRSIGLGLEALRAVDRYGITRTGEQYVGWKALGTGEPAALGPRLPTLDEAAAFLASHAGHGWDGGDLLDEPGVPHLPSVERAFRLAIKHLHPDAGGDAELFVQAQEARRILVEAAQ